MRTWHYLSLAALLLLSLAATAQDAASPDGGEQDASGAPDTRSAGDADNAAGAASGTENAGDNGDEEADAAARDEEDDDDTIDLDDPAYADLDLQTYEEDDDDFVPSEEIPADQAIPFPSDI